MDRIDAMHRQSIQEQGHHVKRRSKLHRTLLLACSLFLSLALGGLTNVTLLSAKAAPIAACDLQNASYTLRQLAVPTINLNNAWAPDSRHFAYADPADGRIKIYDTQTNTTVMTVTPSIQNAYAAAPEWGADGRHIYFSTRPTTGISTGPTKELSNHTPPDMYIINADGSDMQHITIDSSMPSGPSVIYWDSSTPAKFSPDGRHVAFSTLQGVTSDTLAGLANASWVMLLGDLVTVDGMPHLRNVHSLNSPGLTWREVKGFTRDSKELLFAADSTGGSSSSSSMNPDVYTLNLVTGAITRYTSNPAWEETMDVNPVGPFIVFQSDRANPTPPQAFALGTQAHHDLYLAGLQGDAGWTRRLTTDGDPGQGGWDSLRPRWSPNGQEILFQQHLNQTTRTMLLTFHCACPAIS